MSSLKKKRSQKSGKDQTINALKTLTKRGLAAGALATITSVWATKAINAFSSDNVKPEEVKALGELSQGYVDLYNLYLFGNTMRDLYLKVDMFAGSASTNLRNNITDKKDLIDAQNQLVAKYITGVDRFKKNTLVRFSNEEPKTINVYKHYKFYKVERKTTEDFGSNQDILKLLKYISSSTDQTYAKNDTDEEFTVYRFPDCVMVSDSDETNKKKANTNYILAEFKKETGVSYYSLGIQNETPSPNSEIMISFYNCKNLDDDDRIERLLSILEEEKKMEESKIISEFAKNEVAKMLPIV
jgi:hypothetical protein